MAKYLLMKKISRQSLREPTKCQVKVTDIWAFNEKDHQNNMAVEITQQSDISSQ